MFMIIFIIIAVIFLIWYLRHRKVLRLPNITIITGGVKTGKTTLLVYLGLKKYKSVHRKWWFVSKILRKKVEEPLLYSNFPLRNIKYVPITKDLLLRKKRFRYGSVVLISECALVADSQNYKDEFVNESLTIFNKLFGHETKGGFLFYDTQNISDVHYSIKRSCSTYLWIQETRKIPFFLVSKVRELVNSESISSVNVFQEDIDDEIDKFLLISKKTWKKFNCYCYSKFTDELPVEDEIVLNKTGNLTTNQILQIKDFVALNGGMSESDYIKLSYKNVLSRQALLKGLKDEVNSGGV